MNRVEAGHKGGLRTAQLTARECICDRCGQVLVKKARRLLGQHNHFDDIGSAGGQATLDKYGREHFQEIGRKGGRGNTKGKRLGYSLEPVTPTEKGSGASGETGLLS